MIQNTKKGSNDISILWFLFIFLYLLCCMALITTEGVFLRYSRSFKILNDSASSTFLNHRSFNAIWPLLFEVKTALLLFWIICLSILIVIWEIRIFFFPFYIINVFESHHEDLNYSKKAFSYIWVSILSHSDRTVLLQYLHTVL